MNWRFCIDSLQQRALVHCLGSMDEGDGSGAGWGYGSDNNFSAVDGGGGSPSEWV